MFSFFCRHHVAKTITYSWKVNTEIHRDREKGKCLYPKHVNIVDGNSYLYRNVSAQLFKRDYFLIHLFKQAYFMTREKFLMTETFIYCKIINFCVLHGLTCQKLQRGKDKSNQWVSISSYLTLWTVGGTTEGKTTRKNKDLSYNGHFKSL